MHAVLLKCPPFHYISMASCMRGGRGGGVPRCLNWRCAVVCVMAETRTSAPADEQGRGQGYAVCDMWYAVCGMWYAVCGMRYALFTGPGLILRGTGFRVYPTTLNPESLRDLARFSGVVSPIQVRVTAIMNL